MQDYGFSKTLNTSRPPYSNMTDARWFSRFGRTSYDVLQF
ncbi:unnamed protein product [Staurois parvus]|uniref:Uncharacterized protein n=1 Tax=Staurois parvus TaxID=386267 RepID=A0ABN9ALI7_9NEOB|nr:unnamed protein product [Staurois parvus]